TDKVNAEVPSSYTGTIKEIVARAGETLAVGDLMCYIETEVTADSKNTPAPSTAQTEPRDEQVPSNDQSMKTRYSPAVLRLAQENDIDLNQVEGTGRGGRITRKDMEKMIAKQAMAKHDEPQPEKRPPAK